MTRSSSLGGALAAHHRQPHTDGEVRQRKPSQSSFDLLGEMVKFNFDACKQMDSILNSEPKLKKGMIMVNNNLIDSNNSSIRAMVLACDHSSRPRGDGRVCHHQFQAHEALQGIRQARSVRGAACSILNVTDLTQENVSCLIPAWSS